MDIKDRKVKMIEYLKVKLDEQDWHGVSDAANDLRELEIEAKMQCKCGKTNCAGSQAV